MRINGIELLMAVAFIGIASAAPMRVVVVDVSAFRIGHPGAGAEDGLKRLENDFKFAPVRTMTSTTTMTHTRPCGGKMRGKVIDISNTLRKALGLPLIEHSLTTAHIDTMSDGTIRNLRPAFGPGHLNHPHLVYPQVLREPSFIQRLQTALGELGPWEGKFVAFMLGCGIGVLLRMVWIFCSISYKAFTKPNDDEILFAAVDAEDIVVPPPRYEVTYPEEKKETKETKDSVEA